MFKSNICYSYTIYISAIALSATGCDTHPKQLISSKEIRWSRTSLNSGIEVGIGIPDATVDFQKVPPGYYKQSTPVETACSHYSLLMHGKGREDFIRWTALHVSPETFAREAEAILSGEDYFNNSHNILRNRNLNGQAYSMPLAGIVRYEQFCILYIRDILQNGKDCRFADIHTTINCIRVDGKWKIVQTLPQELERKIDIPITRDNFIVFTNQHCRQ